MMTGCNEREEIIMKKTLKLFGLVALSAFVFSCTKETALDIEKENITPADEQQAETPDSPVIPATDGGLLTSFGVTFEGQQDADTKVTVDLGEGTTAIENGDEVLVYVSASNKAVYAYNKDESKFELSSGGPVTLDAPASVFYPAGEFNNETGVFTMPAAVTDLEDLGDKAPMAGQIEGSAGAYTVDLKNLASVLKVGVTGAASNTLTSVTLDATGKSVAAGAAYTVDFSGARPVLATDVADAASSMEVSAGGATLSGTAQTFFFLVPAGLSLGNVTVTATLGQNHNGGTNSFSISKAKYTPVVNKISTMSFYAGLFSGGAGTPADPYKIANARDFKYISKYCAEGYTPGSKDAASFRGATYKQTANINFKDADLSEYMIGGASTPFKGTYDGQSNSLEGFSISGTEECTGLWRVTSGATIKNVRVRTATVTSTAGKVGAIVGRADDGLILDGCVNTASVTASGQTEVGGLVGLSTGGVTIKGCVNQGNVTGANYTGGLVGHINTTESSTIGKNSDDMPTYNRGAISGGSAVGGIVGETTGNTTITDGTYNAGDITGSGQNVGGLVGRQNKDGYVLTIKGGSSNGIPVIENPPSQITIKSNKADASNNQSNVGGLVGLVENGTLDISGSCFNRGTVTGSAMYAGGIVGRIATAGCSVSECINYGDVSTTGTKNSNNYTGGILGCSADGNDVTIVSCTNKGEIVSTKTFVGGIAGRFYTGTIDLCANAGHVNGNANNANNVGGITGGIHTATVKRCYSAKGITVEGGTRVAGIVGIIEQGGKVISCASYSYIKGKYASAGDALGVGCIVGVESNESALIANCVALYDDANTSNHYSLNSAKSAAKKFTGGLVGAKVAGVLQNCYCKVPARWIGFVYNTKGNIVAGTTTNTDNTPYMGQIAGRNTAGDVKDCYYGGFNNGRGAIDFGTHVNGTRTNVTLITADAKTQYMHNTTIPVAVTTSTGTSFGAGTAYLSQILDAGVSGISGYTPAAGEVLTWSNLSASDYTPIPTAILDLYNATEN